MSIYLFELKNGKMVNCLLHVLKYYGAETKLVVEYENKFSIPQTRYPVSVNNYKILDVTRVTVHQFFEIIENFVNEVEEFFSEKSKGNISAKLDNDILTLYSDTHLIRYAIYEDKILRFDHQHKIKGI